MSYRYHIVARKRFKQEPVVDIEERVCGFVDTVDAWNWIDDISWKCRNRPESLPYDLISAEIVDSVTGLVSSRCINKVLV